MVIIAYCILVAFCSFSAHSWQPNNIPATIRELTGTLRGNLSCHLTCRKVYLCLSFLEPLPDVVFIPQSVLRDAQSALDVWHTAVRKSSLMTNLDLAVISAWFSLSSPLRNSKKLVPLCRSSLCYNFKTVTVFTLVRFSSLNNPNPSNLPMCVMFPTSLVTPTALCQSPSSLSWRVPEVGHIVLANAFLV